MDYPVVLQVHSENIGKPLSAFTKEDWRLAAIVAGRFIDKIYRPKPKKKIGRPKKRKLNTLLDLAEIGSDLSLPKRSVSKRSVGRPRAKFGESQLSIEGINNLLEWFLSPETKKKWPKEAPVTKRAAMEMILRDIGHYPSYAESVLRHIRRLKADKIAK